MLSVGGMGECQYQPVCVAEIIVNSFWYHAKSSPKRWVPYYWWKPLKVRFKIIKYCSGSQWFKGISLKNSSFFLFTWFDFCCICAADERVNEVAPYLRYVAFTSSKLCLRLPFVLFTRHLLLQLISHFLKLIALLQINWRSEAKDENWTNQQWISDNRQNGLMNHHTKGREFNLKKVWICPRI